VTLVESNGANDREIAEGNLKALENRCELFGGRECGDNSEIEEALEELLESIPLRKWCLCPGCFSSYI